MPTIFEPKDLHVIEKNGASIATLANQAILGTDALQVERITLDTGAKTSSFPAVDAERFIYVIRGEGQTHVGQQTFSMEAESMLWIEEDDTFYIKAGMNGLEVLLCRAPAGG